MKAILSLAASALLGFGCTTSAQTVDAASIESSNAMPTDLEAAFRNAVAGERTNDDTPWTEQIVSADDGIADDRFGTAVAISGDTAVIASSVWSYGAASSTASTGGDRQGAVYIFERREGAWTNTQKLFASDGASYANFGSALALDGSTLLVAALNANAGDITDQGAVYVFARNDGTWSETQKLSPSDGINNEAFGSAVALKGSTAIIGALDAQPGGNVMQGQAYVFTATGGVWSEQQILAADDGASNDRFGQTVAFDGSTILVGAPTLPYNFVHAGWVYSFEQIDGAWTQTAKIIPDDSTVSDQFGYAIGFAGDTALIGAIGNQFAHGAVYAFARSDGAWTQMQKLSPGDGASGDQFGNAIALSGDTAIVGAEALTAGDRRGAAYVLEKSGATWNDPIAISEGDAGSLDLFGSAVAFDGSTAIVSAPGATVADRNSQGIVHFYAAPAVDAIFSSGFDIAATINR